MKQHLTESHWTAPDGNPTGGSTLGTGLEIRWQHGPLQLATQDDGHTEACRWHQTTPVDCEYRTTHHYCPHPRHACDCNGGRREPNGAFVEGVIQAALGRLQFYNEGKFRCRENSLAITHLEEALHWLQHRTADREEREAEGTHAQ